MPGLNPRGFGQGFRQGFGLMSDYQAQQQQMELQRQQEQRQQQQAQRQQEQFEQQTELREMKIDKARDEMARGKAKQGLKQLAAGQPPGEDSLQAMNELGIEPKKLVTGDYLEAANKLQQGLGAQSLEQGQDLQGPSEQDEMLQEQTQGMALGNQATEQALQSPQAQKRTADALNDPNIIEAANTFMEGRIQRGVGEEVDLPEEAGGGKGQILRKRIKGMTPMGGGTVGMDLEVTARNEDGEVVSYTAPATENRSGDPDDPVQGVPVDELMDHASGLTQEAKAFQMDPQARENAKQALYQMDPDMAPERKIVDLGARGKAVMTEGGGQFGMQPIPGTAERDSDLSSAGQQFRELVAQDVPAERARAIAYGEPDGGGGTGGQEDWQIPVITDQGRTTKTFSDSDLRNHYKTQYDILSQAEIQELRTAAMAAPNEEKRAQYKQMAEEAVRRKAEAPGYNEWVSRVQNRGLDLRTEQGRQAAESQPSPAEQEAEMQRQGANRQGANRPDLMEQARRDPNAYAKVLRQANPDASDEAIRQRVRERFPAPEPKADSTGPIPDAGAAETERADPVTAIVDQLSPGGGWLAGQRPDPGELQQGAKSILDRWPEYAPMFSTNDQRQRVLAELRGLAQGESRDLSGLQSLMEQ